MMRQSEIRGKEGSTRAGEVTLAGERVNAIGELGLFDERDAQSWRRSSQSTI
jgi:hypothetical protein